MPSEPKSGVKKLVLIFATSMPVIETKEEAVKAAESVETAEVIEIAKVGKDGKESKGESPTLAEVPCIWYPITLRKKFVSMSALFNLDSEVNVIHPIFAWELGLPIRYTDIGAQKIDGTMLDTYEMVVTAFSVTGKANWVKFFEEIFLVANVSPEMVIGMPFLTFSSADIDFLGRKLRWKTYTIEKGLPTTRRVKLVGKKEFAAAALDSEHETYIVYIGSDSFVSLPNSSLLDAHPSRRPLISGLTTEELSTKVPAKYLDFADIFSPDLVSELSKHTRINNHAIELVDGQQPPYELIYNLGPVELETLKAYIETNLANKFMGSSKSSAGTPILFDRKSNRSFRLCIDYRGLNNLTIKNWYPLLLIRGLLDRLRRARRFTQLELTSTYHWIRIRKKNKWKTAFKTRYGYFEYQVMPFGFTNAPASFQGYINKIFVEKHNIFVIVYLDDILIYTDNNGNRHVSAIR